MSAAGEHNLPFTVVESTDPAPDCRIKVVGIGGAGCNAVRYFGHRPLEGVELISINTDMQALDRTEGGLCLQIGDGGGSGADPDKAKMLMLERGDDLADMLAPADIVFIFAGMGGGTGTGCAPVVADIAAKTGALVVSIVFYPFEHENREVVAKRGIEALRQSVDAMMVLSNERLHGLHAHKSLEEAFAEMNAVLYGAVRGIQEIVIVPGLINVDFADIRAVMRHSGMVIIGTGTGSGEDAVRAALQQALHNPVLEGGGLTQIRAILCNLTVTQDFSVEAMKTAGAVLKEFASSEGDLVQGIVIDPDMTDAVRATLVVTGDADCRPARDAVKTENTAASTPSPAEPFSHNTPSQDTDYDTPAYTRSKFRQKD